MEIALAMIGSKIRNLACYFHRDMKNLSMESRVIYELSFAYLMHGNTDDALI